MVEIKIEDWLFSNKLQLEYKEEQFLKIVGDNRIFYLLPYKDKLFDKNMFFLLEDSEYSVLDNLKNREDYNILFQFGQQFYYSPIKMKSDENNEDQYVVSLNQFKYIGKSFEENELDTFVGIHTEYELLNSALNFKNAIKKAKFFNIKKLGICDHHTLGATLAFQLECKKNNIAPIIGESVTVLCGDSTHTVKLYPKNEVGWFNLLNINKIINVDNTDKHIPENELLNHGGGIICIFDYSDSVLRDLRDNKRYRAIINSYKDSFDSIAYQFSTVEYVDDKFDLKCLEGFKYFINNYADKDCPAVLIEDIYYLEKEHEGCKEALNKIGNLRKQHSFEQHFKSTNESFTKISKFFESSDFTLEDFKEILIEETCKLFNYEFSIDLSGGKLPKYELDNHILSDDESDELLKIYCEEGFESKIVNSGEFTKEEIEIYRKRLDKEIDVIVGAGFSNYFLIIKDTIQYVVDKGGMIGIGRGSVGGSLLAYLIGIIRIDPIKCDLSFERFLNEARIAPEFIYTFKTEDGILESKKGLKVKTEDGEKFCEDVEVGDFVEVSKVFSKVCSISVLEKKRYDSMPDVDTDFQTEERDEVKNYLKDKYGRRYTCSVGTYGRLKLRQTFKDLSKIHGIPFNKSNELTKRIDDQTEYEFLDLFKYATTDQELYRFIQEHVDLVEQLEVVINNPKSVSIHPSAVLVLPKFDDGGRDRDVFNWIPVRSIDGSLVAEWEGKYCDIFGLLKNDILGLNQLDKFTKCLKMIKQNYGLDIDLDKINLDDKKTFKRFQKGFNEDIFQFNGIGMKSFSKEVLPDTIEDLVAMNALFRPATISMGIHKDYALIKHGKKRAEYDLYMEPVTRKTYGLYVYQEQVMAAFVQVGFTPVESDNVRTAIKKKDKKFMESVKEKFIKLYTDKIDGQVEDTEEYANRLWDKLMAFSGYGFNRSHSFSYGLIAYQAQWLKANYPLEFWTTALNFGDENVDIPKFISEIKELQNEIKGANCVTITCADINKSTLEFECDKDRNEIKWSLIKIKGVAEKVATKIIEKRKEVGGFKSLKHFMEVVPKQDCNKKVLSNLIVAGAFDNLESIKSEKDRLLLLFEFYETMGHDYSNCEFMNSPINDRDYFWILKQKELTGYGEIDYLRLLKEQKVSKGIIDNFTSPEQINAIKNSRTKGERKVTICGILNDVFEFGKSRDKKHIRLMMDCNSVFLEVVIWHSMREDFEINFHEEKGCMFCITGNIKYEDKRNTVYIYDRSRIIKL